MLTSRFPFPGDRPHRLWTEKLPEILKAALLVKTMAKSNERVLELRLKMAKSGDSTHQPISSLAAEFIIWHIFRLPL